MGNIGLCFRLRNRCVFWGMGSIGWLCGFVDIRRECVFRGWDFFVCVMVVGDLSLGVGGGRDG